VLCYYSKPMINVEITRNGTENSMGTLRRFTKKVQGSGILPRVRSLRYNQRVLSSYKTKMKTLKSLKRKAEVLELIKLGKMQEKTSRYSK
jgi:hypothetical protein